MANKNCLIYETLNGVKEMSVKKENGLMTLTGTFGVCGVRNGRLQQIRITHFAHLPFAPLF